MKSLLLALLGVLCISVDDAQSATVLSIEKPPKRAVPLFVQPDVARLNPVTDSLVARANPITDPLAGVRSRRAWRVPEFWSGEKSGLSHETGFTLGCLFAPIIPPIYLLATDGFTEDKRGFRKGARQVGLWGRS